MEQLERNDIASLMEKLGDYKGEIPQLPTLNDNAKKEMYAFAYNLYERGKYEDATNFFQLLTLLDTYARRNWMGLGATLQMNQEYAKAAEAYAFAAILDKDDPFAHMYAAECFSSQDKIAEAMQALNSAEITAKADKKYVKVLSRIVLLREAWNKRGKVK